MRASDVMVATPSFDLLAPVCPDNGCQCSTAGTEPAEQIPTGAGSELPSQLDRERDLGSLDFEDDYTGDWRGEYGDSVGISSWRTL